MLKTTPAVFAVGKSYQILAPVTADSLFWIRVGEKSFYDERNGVMRSHCATHRVTVPMELLDRAGEYTVCEKEMLDRKPYFPVSGETTATTFRFHPLPEHEFRAYHVADTHGQLAAPVAAASQFGAIHLLIMNGDLPDDTGKSGSTDLIFQIAEELTGGGLPIVFARGNHDLRGPCADQLGEHTPQRDGAPYYTFRLGSLWGMILDCGEDKADSNEEYAGTVHCHAFREKQTDFIRAVITDSKNEYEADGIAYKMVVCHAPFTRIDHPPFDIEKTIYSEWTALLKQKVKPDVMLCGHLHRLDIFEVGGPEDSFGQPCPVIIGSDTKPEYHAGCGLTFSNGGITSVFADSAGKTTLPYTIKAGTCPEHSKNMG